MSSPAGRWAIASVLVAYWVTLAVMTHIPSPPTPSIPYIDKVMHFGAYAVLGGLCWLATRAFSINFRAFVVFAVLAAYGILDELLQIPVGRTCDVVDWLSDCAGIAAGIAVARWLVPPAEVGQQEAG